MATYLEELHQLFPNGLHAASPPVCEPKVELLIDIFDDVKIEDEKAASHSTAAAHDLVDAILYQIDPSLVSKKEPAFESLPTASSPASNPEEKPSISSSVQSLSIDAKKAISAQQTGELSGSPLSSPHSATSAVSEAASARRSPQELHGLAGKAIARKYDVFTSNAEGLGMRRVEKPVLVPKKQALRTSLDSASKPASATSPTSSKSTGTSEETSPAPLRFISIAGSSARAKAQAEAQKRGTIKSSEALTHPVSHSSSSAGVQQPPNRMSIFNKTTTVRLAAAPIRRRSSSSESEASPRRPRYPSYEARRQGAPSSSSRPGDRQRGSTRTTEKPKGHAWEYDGTEQTKPASCVRYISSGVIVDRNAPPPGPEPDFVGYQNGWKPLNTRRPSDGYVLGGSNSRYNNRTSDDEQEEPDGRTPFHWTGDVDSAPGKRRIIGKGALGSKPGTYKSRSDERFAAATAALEREQEREYANLAPDPLGSMHPAAASWEMQRRGILLRNDRKSRGVRA